MLRAWTEILPLFVIRRLAKKCETHPWYHGNNRRDAACPRPGVLIYDMKQLKEKDNA